MQHGCVCVCVGRRPDVTDGNRHFQGRFGLLLLFFQCFQESKVLSSEHSKEAMRVAELNKHDKKFSLFLFSLKHSQLQQSVWEKNGYFPPQHTTLPADREPPAAGLHC